MNSRHHDAPDGPPPEFEDELAAAMTQFAERERPPAFDPEAIRRAGARRPRPAVALAAGVAVAATVVAVVLTAGGPSHDRPQRPATHPATSAPALPTAAPPTGYDDLAKTTRDLLTAAQLYQDPATRARVDTARVAALFVDQQTFQRLWAGTGSPVTCGQQADGAVIDSPGDITLYRGVNRLPQHSALGFDDTTGLINDVTCAPANRHAGDQAVADRYGTLVTTGTGPLDCGSPRPSAWTAYDPAAATAAHGWTMTLDGGKPFKINVSETQHITTDCAHP